MHHRDGRDTAVPTSRWRRAGERHVSLCGSQNMLEFMCSLGIAVPRWLENKLPHSHDILEKSVDLSLAAFADLHDFPREEGIPLGSKRAGPQSPGTTRLSYEGGGPQRGTPRRLTWPLSRVRAERRSTQRSAMFISALSAA